jgi:hypothetical protein
MDPKDSWVNGALKTYYAKKFDKERGDTVMLPKVWKNSNKGEPVPYIDTKSIECIEGWKDLPEKTYLG